jgi:hypothetical protein
MELLNQLGRRQRTVGWWRLAVAVLAGLWAATLAWWLKRG